MKKPSKNTTRKPLPKFKNEQEESAFWLTHDSTDYIDWSRAQKAVFPNLAPSTQTISLRLPKSLLNNLKLVANKHDVPYQSLMKLLLAQALERDYPNKP